MFFFCTCEFSQIRQRVTHVLAELKPANPSLPARLKQRAWRKFGADHPVSTDVVLKCSFIKQVGMFFDTYSFEVLSWASKCRHSPTMSFCGLNQTCYPTIYLTLYCLISNIGTWKQHSIQVPVEPFELYQFRSLCRCVCSLDQTVPTSLLFITMFSYWVLWSGVNCQWHAGKSKTKLSRSTFQSSNPIGQYITYKYMCICTVAQTTP